MFPFASLNDFQDVWYQCFWKVKILNFYSSKFEIKLKPNTFYIKKQKQKCLYGFIHILDKKMSESHKDIISSVLD